MRLTRTDIYNAFYRNTQNVGSSDPDLLANFNYQLGIYYQLMLAKLKNYKTYISTSFSTVAGTQYYANPPGYVTSDGIVITVGSVNYPLKLISSESIWEQLNSVLLQASAVPQFYYPRRDDFGIWPIPQAIYTGNIYYHYRDRNLSVDDYQAGSILVTSGSTAVVGTGTAFTDAMIGRWLTVSDPTVPGQGYWYRILGRSGQTLTLFQKFVGATTSGVTGYRIGETPEIPEDLHTYLVSGVTGGYYKDIRKDKDNAATFLNEFWTGNPANSNWKENGEEIVGGLLGGMKAYSDREDERVINRKPGLSPLQFKAFATTLA